MTVEIIVSTIAKIFGKKKGQKTMYEQLLKEAVAISFEIEKLQQELKIKKLEIQKILLERKLQDEN